MNRKYAITAALMALSSSAFAQTTYTWDPDGTQTNDGGSGTWDLATSNWDDDGLAPNTTWVNGHNAIFGDAAANYTVNVVDGGVTVGDLTYTGSNRLLLQSVTDNLGTITIKAGGATWDTGGGEIEFHNIQTFDTPLSISSGDTLTIIGGGTFDGGEKANDANWTAAGATLDVTEATIVRGNTSNISQFGTVKLADGSIFVQERNSDQGFGNDWVLNGTQVSFGNRYNRKSFMTGVISGDARLRYFNGGNYSSFLRIDNPLNTWTGGLMVDRPANNTQIILNTTDGGLGAVPVSFDEDNIILKDLGNLRFNVATTIDANRGITLDGGGILATGVAISIDGAITGDGGLQYGYGGGPGGNLTLNATSTYTGETWLFEGNLIAGTTNAVGQGVLKLGGTEGFARLILNEQSQTLGGIYNNGSQTKQIVNINAATTGSTAGTLTLDVADGETYAAGSATGVNAATDQGNFNIIKNGLGSQELGNLQIAGDVTVNAGTLIVGNNSGTSVMGNASVTGGTLRIDESVTATSYTTSGTGILQIGDSATGANGNIVNVDVANEGAVVFDRDSGNSLTYSGVISGTGPVTFTGGGNAVLLGVAQTYTGDTIIANKQLSANGVANALSSESVIRFGGDGTGNTIFQLKGQDQQAGGLVADSLSKDIRNDAGTVDFTLDVATGESFEFSANVAGGGTINIVKSGDGTQTFSRSGGYTKALGSVTVNGGILNWNNDNGATQTGAVTVADQGTLGGTGILGGAVTVQSGGTITAGASAGTLTVPSMTLEDGSNVEIEIDAWNAGTVVAGTDSDLIVVTGALTGHVTADGTTIVIPATPGDFTEVSANFDIITFASATDVTDSIFAIDDTAWTGTGTWSVSVDADSVILTYTVSGGADPYDTWTDSFGLVGGDADEDADPDFDGIANVLEWILGGNPTISDNSILPVGTINGANFELSFTRSDDSEGEAEASVQFGSDLTSFPTDTEIVPAATSVVGSVSFTIVENGAAADDVTASFPIGVATELFGRVSGALLP